MRLFATLLLTNVGIVQRSVCSASVEKLASMPSFVPLEEDLKGGKVYLIYSRKSS